MFSLVRSSSTVQGTSTDDRGQRRHLAYCGIKCAYRVRRQSLPAARGSGRGIRDQQVGTDTQQIRVVWIIESAPVHLDEGQPVPGNVMFGGARVSSCDHPIGDVPEMIATLHRPLARLVAGCCTGAASLRLGADAPEYGPARD